MEVLSEEVYALNRDLMRPGDGSAKRVLQRPDWRKDVVELMLV